MGYVEELEKQNEELKHKLSLSQRHSDYWRSHVDREFHFSVANSYKDGTEKIELHEYFILQTCEGIKDYIKERTLERITIERYNGNYIAWTVDIFPKAFQITVYVGKFNLIKNFKTHEEFVEAISNYIDSKPYMLGND